MDHFSYQSGVLCAEDVSIETLADNVGTPFYCYSTGTLQHHYTVFRDAVAAEWPGPVLVAYSVKANGNQAVIATLGAMGAGADIVSLGELKRARAAGIPAKNIIFSGVGKTREELAAALQDGIFQFNVESEPELEALSSVATELNVQAPIALRVNPDVDAGSHHKISTGRKRDKFGIPIARAVALYQRAATLSGIEVRGLDVHIGSQLTDLEPFRLAFARIASLIEELRGQGHEIDRIDIGGGLGIPYSEEVPPIPGRYAAMIKETLGHLGGTLVLEPGRLIVGNAGILVARVIYVKETEGHRFAILDAAMNDLVRPAMYDAWHTIEPVREAPSSTALGPIDLVGPICETGDTFARDRMMPPMKAGDLVAFRSAGAYGAVMAGTYNTRALIPEVMVRGGDHAVVRPRVSTDALIAMDRLPPWIETTMADSDTTPDEGVAA